LQYSKEGPRDIASTGLSIAYVDEKMSMLQTSGIN